MSTFRKKNELHFFFFNFLELTMFLCEKTAVIHINIIKYNKTQIFIINIFELPSFHTICIFLLVLLRHPLLVQVKYKYKYNVMKM